MVGNALKPRISKIHNVQETQKKSFKTNWQQSVCYFYIFHFGRLCIRILVQAIETLWRLVSKPYFRKNLIFVKNHYVRFCLVAIDVQLSIFSKSIFGSVEAHNVDVQYIM